VISERRFGFICHVLPMKGIALLVALYAYFV